MRVMKGSSKWGRSRGPGAIIAGCDFPGACTAVGRAAESRGGHPGCPSPSSRNGPARTLYLAAPAGQRQAWADRVGGVRRFRGGAGGDSMGLVGVAMMSCASIVQLSYDGSTSPPAPLHDDNLTPWGRCSKPTQPGGTNAMHDDLTQPAAEDRLHAARVRGDVAGRRVRAGGPAGLRPDDHHRHQGPGSGRGEDPGRRRRDPGLPRRCRPTAGPSRSILVVQEIFGVHEHIKDICRRLAKLGYFAVAPELYARQGDVSKLEGLPRDLSRSSPRCPTRR